MLLYILKGANKGNRAMIFLISLNDHLFIPKLRLNVKSYTFWWENECCRGISHHKQEDLIVHGTAGMHFFLAPFSYRRTKNAAVLLHLIGDRSNFGTG